VKENACFSNRNITMRSRFLKEERQIGNSSKESKENSQVKVRWLEIGDKWDLIK